MSRVVLGRGGIPPQRPPDGASRRAAGVRGAAPPGGALRGGAPPQEWESIGTAEALAEAAARSNLLVHGENLAVLRALAAHHAGTVACAYLDPPYGTGTTFAQYDDPRHDRDGWLPHLEARVRQVHALLREDGVLALQIDDRAQARVQLLLDEVFGARQRLNTVVVKMSELSGVKMAHARRLPKLKEYLLLYGRTAKACLRPLRVPKPPEVLDGYLRYYAHVVENPDDAVEDWRIVPIRAYLAARGLPDDAGSVRAFQLANARRVVYRTSNRALARLSFPTATARVRSPTGRDWVWWEGRQALFLADHLDAPLGDVWTDVSTIPLDAEGGVAFPGGKKPEMLIRRVLQLASAPGDLVLDPYAGSGTTAAVAQKMGRRWWTVEQAPSARTHAAVRLGRVCDGADAAGVSRVEGWTGGGGFRTLAWTGTEDAT
ncbi:MAG: hypothetical protein RLZZ299_1871 [Pseudomonadota bacterium]